MFMDKKIQYCQAINSSQIDLKIQCNSNQNPSKLSYGYQQNNSKVYMRVKKKPRIANALLKNNKVGELTLFDFKTCHKVAVIKKMWYVKE